jgi:hypothetical protein
MKVKFNNPRTGQIKSVKVGWNWALFMSGSLIGLPLFWNGLPAWGSVMVSLWALGLIISHGTGTVILTVIGMGLSIFLGVNGNEMIAKNYLQQGWEFADPESTTVKIAKEQWGLETERWDSET